MSNAQPHATNDPVPTSALPFFGTAPLAVAAAGCVLATTGERALQSNWSTLTMSLTHLGTLGYLSMIMIGSFYILVPAQLDKRIKAPRLPYVSYGFLLLGVASLCLGLGGVSIQLVFTAIGTLFPALCLFFWPGIAALRGTRGHPNAAPLRLAMGAFLIVSTLGIWVAHGHGGMKFPGPRGLWIELHLSIALFGWIGGMSCAGFNALARARQANTDGIATPGTHAWWGRLTLLGITAPAILLTLQYFELFTTTHERFTWIGAVCVFPVALANCWLQPFHGLRLLKNRQHDDDDEIFWRTSFALGPLIFILGVIALASPAQPWRFAFGWLALWGWAGLPAHAMLRAFSRRFTQGSGPQFGTTRAAHSKTAFAIHVVSLAMGLAAIAAGTDNLARATGVALLVVAAVQSLDLFRALRGRRGHSTHAHRGSASS